MCCVTVVWFLIFRPVQQSSRYELFIVGILFLYFLCIHCGNISGSKSKMVGRENVVIHVIQMVSLQYQSPWGFQWDQTKMTGLEKAVTMFLHRVVSSILCNAIVRMRVCDNAIFVTCERILIFLTLATGLFLIRSSSDVGFVLSRCAPDGGNGIKMSHSKISQEVLCG